MRVWPTRRERYSAEIERATSDARLILFVQTELDTAAGIFRRLVLASGQFALEREDFYSVEAMEKICQDYDEIYHLDRRIAKAVKQMLKKQIQKGLIQHPRGRKRPLAETCGLAETTG